VCHTHNVSSSSPGSHNAGKSTVFKQSKLIHAKGFNADECLRFKDVILSTVLRSIQQLVTKIEELNLEYECIENVTVAKQLSQLSQNVIFERPSSIMNEELGKRIDQLWRDHTVLSCYEQYRNVLELSDSVYYFLNEVERISQSNYGPSRDDILRVTDKSTDIIEAEFFLSGHAFKMIDIGGQRNKRTKWLHMLDNVTAIIYVISLSEYDQYLEEDSQTNKMQEALILFDELCNNSVFQRTPIMLFLNKRDLFEEKIKAVDLNVCFPDYKGGKDKDLALKFIEQKFMEKNKNNRFRNIYITATCATDSDQVVKVFEFVKNITLTQQMKSLSMV
jgi:guanine nucleotide-binding protein G(i) subunit alpha